MAEENIVIKIKADVGISKEVIEAVTKAMEGLGKTATIVSGNVKVTNKNLEDTSKILGQVTQSAGAAGKALGDTGNTLKKSNQQWTNLALVIQDLPYGFRGIQNNLPALIGGFAGVSGAAYVLGSALIAIWTAYGDEITKVIFKTNELDVANKQLKDGMIDSVKSTAGAREELFKVAAVIKSGKDNLIDKTAALDYYNEKLGVTFGVAKTLEEAEAKMVEKTPEYIKAIGLKAKAQFYYAKAAEYAIKGDIAGLEDQTNIFDKLIAFSKGFADIATIGPKGIIKGILGSLSTAQSDAVNKITKNSKIIGDILFKNGNDSMDQYFKGLKAAGLSDEEIQGIFKKFQAARDKLGKTKATTLEDPNIKLLEAKKQYYKDDLLMAASFEEEILARKRDLAVRQAELEGKSAEDIQIIKDTYNQLIINSQKNTADKIIEIQRKLGLDDAKEYEKNTKEEEKNNKERISRGEKSYEESLNAVNQFYENKLNLATADKNQQLEILKEEQAYFDILYGLRLIGDQDYANKSAEITKAKVQKEKAIIKESFDSLMQFGNGIMSALGPSLDMLLSKSASIGDVLKSAFNDLLKQLIKVTLSAAVAVTLISILFPTKLATAGGIGKLFGGLFSQGMGLGKNLFAEPTANGGVFSGPSYRLVGEYPGAKTNPEVVAPLDKLKSMMGSGSGSGEFVLRGNDLILAIQRSNSSLKLRRG